MSKTRKPTIAQKDEALDELVCLRRLLDSRIVEMHEVKGKQAERHAFILYRNKANAIMRLLWPDEEE